MFFCYVMCLLCLSVRLFICALWSPAGKGLTSWLPFLVSNCEFVTFPLVSWVRCGTLLYRFPIFASLLTFLSLPRLLGSWMAILVIEFANICISFLINHLLVCSSSVVSVMTDCLLRHVRAFDDCICDKYPNHMLSFICGSRGGTGGPDPHTEKSQIYKVF